MAKFYKHQPGTSNMHTRRKFTFNHKETALIDTALENLEDVFRKGKNTEYLKQTQKVRMSLIHQEQEHFNKERGYPKGAGYKIDFNGKPYRNRRKR